MISTTRHGANEFEILSFVENGVGSKIYDVVHKHTKRYYTMEVTPRKQVNNSIFETKLQKYLKNEMPFLVKIHYHFCTKSRDYFVMTHVKQANSLVFLLSKKGRLTEKEATFIVTELILVIERLHSSGVVYGEIDKENVYFDENGHVLLRRTYNGKSYWSKDECFHCTIKTCVNIHHISRKPSQAEKRLDWKSLIELYSTLTIGTQLSNTAHDFIKHDSSEASIRKHLLFSYVNWEQIEAKELLVPIDIHHFVKGTLVKNNTPEFLLVPEDQHTYENTHTRSLSERAYYDTPIYNTRQIPIYRSKSWTEDDMNSLLVEGIRRPQSHATNRYIPRTINRERTTSDSYITRRYNNNFNSNISPIPIRKSKEHDAKEIIGRRKSIDIYRKRLEEISKVLENNRNMMESMNTDNCEINLNSRLQLKWDSQRKSYTTESTSLANRLYSENDSIREILSRYGLLKDRQSKNDLDCAYTKVRNEKRDTMGKDTGTTTTEKIFDHGADDCEDHINLRKSFEKANRTERRRSNTVVGIINYDKTKLNVDSNKNIDHQTSINENQASRNLEFVQQSNIECSVNNNKGESEQKEQSVKTAMKNRSERLSRTSTISEGIITRKKRIPTKNDLKNNTKTKSSWEITVEKHEILHQRKRAMSKSMVDLGSLLESHMEETRTNGLSSSKTNLLDQLQDLGGKTKHFRGHQPNRQPPELKRHFSDITPLSSPRLGRSPDEKRESTVARSLTYSGVLSTPHRAVQSDSMLDETGPMGNSYDSGMLDVNDNSDDEVFEDNTTKTVHRSDSGIVMKRSSSAQSGIKVWQPGQPDQIFLQEEEIKMKERFLRCYDCGKENEEPELREADSTQSFHMCNSCSKSRTERKEAIIELIQTEINYGHDLRVLKQEFYNPMKKNAVCTQDELNKIFSNLQELLDVNSKLCTALQHGLECCSDHDDEDYSQLGVGEIFLNCVELFEAYEIFCAKQPESKDVLETLRKKSDLLRIFLNVSSKDNSKLRKMDLKSFLTMPIQRIMKYPLLLSRIYKNTPAGFQDKNVIKLAISKIEQQIHTINHISRNDSTLATNLKKRYTVSFSQQNLDASELARPDKFVANLQGWKQEDTLVLLQTEFDIIMESLVDIESWGEKLLKKSIRVKALLCVHGASENFQKALNRFIEKPETNIACNAKEAVIVLIKKKSNDKCLLYKTPLNLNESVISTSQTVSSKFEILQRDKVPYLFVPDSDHTFTVWKQTLDLIMISLELKWRRRRGGMSNIMIPTML